MNQCKHKLNLVQNILVSRTIRFNCLNCGNSVYRVHNRTLTFWGPLFPIWTLALVGCAFVSTTLFLASLGLIVIMLIGVYLIDSKRNLLHIYSLDESRKDKVKALKSLLLALGIVMLGALLEFAT